MDLTLNNLQRLIYHKIQPTNQPTFSSANDGFVIKYTTKFDLPLNRETKRNYHLVFDSF